MSFSHGPGEVSSKELPPNRQSRVSHLTSVMNNMLPQALKSFSDHPDTDDPPCPWAELVWNPRPAVTSEVWHWVLWQGMGEWLSLAGESGKQWPGVPAAFQQPVSIQVTLIHPTGHPGEAPAGSELSGAPRLSEETISIPPIFQKDSTWRSWRCLLPLWRGSLEKGYWSSKNLPLLLLNSSLWNPGCKPRPFPAIRNCQQLPSPPWGSTQLTESCVPCPRLISLPKLEDLTLGQWKKVKKIKN